MPSAWLVVLAGKVPRVEIELGRLRRLSGLRNWLRVVRHREGVSEIRIFPVE